MTAVQPEYVLVRYDRLRHISMQLRDIEVGTLHEHGVLELGLVLEGTANLQCENTVLSVPAGEMFLVNAYENHRLYAQPRQKARVLSLWISHQFGREYFPGVVNTVFEQRTLAGQPAQATMQLRQLLLDAADSYFREEKLECVGTVSHLLALLLRLMPHKLSTEAQKAVCRKRTGRMQRIAAYLDQHYKEKITLAQLAQTEGLTPAYMSRVFTELFGMSFQEYLNLLRLEQAIAMIRDPKIYLTDVCMECGFSDTRYLNTTFRKTFGCSAVEYRKQCTGENHDAVVRELREKRFGFMSG